MILIREMILPTAADAINIAMPKKSAAPENARLPSCLMRIPSLYVLDKRSILSMIPIIAADVISFVSTANIVMRGSAISMNRFCEYVFIAREKI